MAGNLEWAGLDVLAADSLMNAVELVARQGQKSYSTVLVTDLPGLTHEHSQRIRRWGYNKLVHLCLAGSDSYGCDLLITGFPADLPARTMAGRVLRGPEFLVVRPEVVAARPVNLRPVGSIASVLVAMGGTDPGGNAQRTLDWLRATGARASVLASPGMDAERLALMLAGHGTVVSGEHPQDVVQALMSNDLVVTQGGLLSAEAMCLGSPVACIQWQELGSFVKALETSGFVTLLDLDLPDGKRHGWLQSQPWEIRRTEAFEVVDGLGAKRIADEILDCMGVG
jgi:spore coat polysaccharide biosynthesis predicted glycosyltransferase SpsG